MTTVGVYPQHIFLVPLTEKEKKGCLAYEHQSEALNESIADIFGIMTKPYQGETDLGEVDWSIGRGIYRENSEFVMRSKDNPTASNVQ